MIGKQLTSIENADTHLGMIADNLPAYTSFASHGYFMSVIGFLFLGHATSRHHGAEAAIENRSSHRQDAEAPAGQCRHRRIPAIRHAA